MRTIILFLATLAVAFLGAAYAQPPACIPVTVAGFDGCKVLYPWRAPMWEFHLGDNSDPLTDPAASACAVGYKDGEMLFQGTYAQNSDNVSDWYCFPNVVAFTPAAWAKGLGWYQVVMTGAPAQAASAPASSPITVITH